MGNGALQALIFDVDGTLADTESVHLAAFNHAFSQLGLGWVWTRDMYLNLLGISGGRERIHHYWKQINPEMKEVGLHALQDRIDCIHELKTAFYESAVNSGAVSLRPGVLRLMDEALSDGLQLAISCTTSPVNVAALLRHAVGEDWRMNFTAVGDASKAPLKKPHPQLYRQMIEALQLSAAQCLAIEDSSNGLRAAMAAGLATIITPNRFTSHHDFTGAIKVVPDLSQVTLVQLRQWQNSRRG